LRNPFNIGVAEEKEDFCDRTAEKERFSKQLPNSRQNPSTIRGISNAMTFRWAAHKEHWRRCVREIW
jgi:hypothetical protein